MLEDINKEIYNLSYSLLARTYLGGEIKDNKNTYSEFYSILKDIFEKLLKAIDVILCNSNHNLVKENTVLNHQRYLMARGHLFLKSHFRLNGMLQ